MRHWSLPPVTAGLSGVPSDSAMTPLPPAPVLPSVCTEAVVSWKLWSTSFAPLVGGAELPWQVRQSPS